MPYYPPASGGSGGAVDSVNGRTGNVELNASDVGAVESVNSKTGVVELNASDVGAVESVNGQTGEVVLDAKTILIDESTPEHGTIFEGIEDKAATVHTHAIADVTGLQSALDGKAASSHTQVATTVTVAAGEGIVGANVQAVLEDLAARVAALESA